MIDKRMRIPTFLDSWLNKVDRGCRPGVKDVGDWAKSN